MNYRKHSLLWTTIIFLTSSFSAWTNSISFSRADSLYSQDIERQESAQNSSETTLPLEVQTAVLQAASQQTSRAVASLVILDFQAREWSDGCLGLTEPGKVCVQNVVSGWQVEVSDGLRNWTFRTDDSGDLVKLVEPEEE